MKVLLKPFRMAVIAVLLLSLAGCAIPNPAKPETSLIVGKLALEANGWRTMAACDINGRHEVNVYLYFENCDTHRVSIVNTNNYGFFYLANPKPGNYIIKSLSYEQKGEDSVGSVEDLRWQPNPELSQIQVNPGQVVNLGALRWVADQKAKTYQLVQDADSAKALNDYFFQTFPKSLWLQREWVSPAIQTAANQNPPELSARETIDRSLYHKSDD